MQATEKTLIEKSYCVNSINEAKVIIGGNVLAKGFSETSKMPCLSYSLPATFCKTGEKLRMIEGSVCENCYACPNLNKSEKGLVSGWYDSDRVQGPMTKRLLAVLFNPRWTDAMILLLSHYKFPIFRWHDSGDIYDMEHFNKLCKIADSVPETLFWLPTQEWQIITDYWESHGRIPLKELHPNLIIRLSGRMKDGPAPTWLARKIGVATSRVSTKETDVDCPASKQGNSCGQCRKCWDYNVEVVTYHFHNGNDNVMKSEFIIDVKKMIDAMLSHGSTKREIDKTVSQKFSIQKLNVRLIRANLLKQYRRKLKVLEK